MNPSFRVFKGEFSGEIVEFLDKRFIVYVDGEKRGKHWIANNFKNYKLFYIWGLNLAMFNVDDFDENSYPDFIVYFNEDENISNDLWDVINSWLKFNLKSLNFNDDDVKQSLVFDATFKGVDFVKSKNEYYDQSVSVPPCPVDNLVYDFEKKYLEDIDVCLYQVKRSPNDVPFTVVVNNFKKVYNMEDKVFFTDIYGSNAWDSNKIYARYDYTFLCKLWKYLGLSGEFNMEIVKERIAACFPDRLAEGIPPQQEPRVYRKSIDDCVSHVYKIFGN